MSVFRIARSCLLIVVLLGPVPAVAAEESADDAGERRGDETFWASGFSLMPAPGLYRHGGSHGDTEPLTGDAAHGTGALTWVATFPETDTYHAWIRRYTGRGGATVTLNEADIEDGRGRVGGGRTQYSWYHMGAAEVEAGDHHVDLHVANTFFDAVLFTRDESFDPTEDELPPPTMNPTFTAPRLYRDDTRLADRAGEAGLVVAGLADRYAEHHNDLVPEPEEVLDGLDLWGSANQYVTGTVVLRALRPTGELTLRLDELAGPEGATIDAERIDLRLVHLRERERRLHASVHRDGRDHDHTLATVPDLLLRDDRTGYPPTGEQGGYGGGACVTDIPAHRSRQLWLTVHVPEDAPAGEYRGRLVMSTEAGDEQKLPVTVEVLPIDLRDVEGYYGSYYRARLDTDRAGAIPREQFLADLELQARYGFNAATLYAGFDAINLPLEAGMTEAPVLMHNPSSSRHVEQRDRAREMGFTDLYYYGVDEPRSESQIERTLNVTARAREIGLHVFMAVNNRGAYEQIREHITRPVLVMYNFDARRGQDHIQFANEQGFRPVSYWTTNDSFPLIYRALAGLYNKAAGYDGIAPWASMDYAIDAAPHEGRYMLHVPDERGEPVPSVRLEACRDGIDDVRYLQALDRAIAEATQRLEPDSAETPSPLADALAHAREVRKQRFESISGWYFSYVNRISRQSGVLDESRREMAEAYLKIREHLE